MPSIRDSISILETKGHTLATGGIGEGAPLVTTADHAGGESNDTDELQSEVLRLRGEVRDLKIALLTSNEHGDLLEEHLFRLNTSLSAEIRERQGAEERLQKVVDRISREKGDLEILVQILNDQGDMSAEEGEKARIDGLTQIANRRKFDEVLLNEWERNARTRSPLSLLICDVDHFKLYNDCYGHQAGDECLKLVADVIRQSVRPGDLVARYGGEEFAVVLPHAPASAALRVAERVRLAVESARLPHATSPVSSSVTLSVGLGCMIPQEPSVARLHALVEAADRSLYLAKRNGRNRISHQEENI